MIRITCLLVFAIISQTSLAVEVIKFPKYFQFGLANAPAHAEDELHDSWLDFANDGHVKPTKTKHDLKTDFNSGQTLRLKLI